MGLPSKESRKEREEGVSWLGNTSQNTEGILVGACSAAYVDPAASFRGGFTGIDTIPSQTGNSSFNSQKLFKNGISKPVVFYRGVRHNVKRGMMPVLPKEDAWIYKGTVGWWSNPR